MTTQGSPVFANSAIGALVAAVAILGLTWLGQGWAASALACLALALLYRAPALRDPWGFVNKDGAFVAFVALHLLQGVRPAPVFTEGANYQGTLKGHLAALLSLISGCQDFSLLMLLASLLLYLGFMVATMLAPEGVTAAASGSSVIWKIVVAPSKIEAWPST